jgi:tetratricopeptide (TPR) repeat protein
VFHRGAVTDLLPADEQAAAGAQLLSAIRRNLVRPHPADLPGEEGFRFVHVLVHDAVYGSMPKELRAQLHEGLADWLEAHGTTLLEQDELLGYHLERAATYRQELGLPDDGLAERAGARLAAAGRRALWRMDHRAAASLLGRALELTRPIRRDTHLEVDLAYAVGFSAPRRAVPIAEAAAAEAQAAGDEPGTALARVVGAYFRVWSEADPHPPVDELEALARAALPLVEQTGDHAGLVNVWWALAMVANWRSRLGELIEADEQALHHARLAGQRAVYPLLYPAFGAALLLGPLPADEALRKVDRLLADHPSDWLLMVRAGLLAMLGRFEDARSIGLDASARLRERLGDQGPVEQILALIAWLAGQYEAAAEHLHRVWDIWEKQREPGDPPVYDLDLGRMLCKLGRHDEAEPIARLGREFGTQDELGTQMQWRQVQALVDAHRGEHEEAEMLAREAVAIGEQTDSPYRQAEALYDLGEVLRAAGKHLEAADALAQALDQCERKRILPMARQVRATLRAETAAAG